MGGDRSARQAALLRYVDDRGAGRLDAAHLLRGAARHAVVDGDLDAAREQLAAQLACEVVGDPPAGQAHEGRAVQAAHDQLRPGAAVERQPAAQRCDLEARPLLPHAQHPGLAAGDLRAHIELGADRTEPEQPDAVLPCSIGSRRCCGVRLRLREWPMWVAMCATASGRANSGITPSPSSSRCSLATPRSRTRVIVSVREPASSESCTSSASALRGSVCGRASPRIRSKGSAALSRPYGFRGLCGAPWHAAIPGGGAW